MGDFFIYRHAWRYNLAPDLEPKLTKTQCKALLKKGGWMVRNTYQFDCKQETNFWYIIKDSIGGLEELSSNVRRKVRRSLEQFDYRLIDKNTIRDQGYSIIQDTYKNYQIKDRSMSQKIFDKYLDYCNNNEYDYWGIFNKEENRLVGFCAVHIWNNCCEFGKTGIYSQYKKQSFYPYYGLYYKMNEYYLNQHHFKYVTDSSRSITEHSNIHQFLEQNFNFRKAYCHLQVTYNWWFGIIVRLLYPFRTFVPSRNVRAVLFMHSYRG